MTIDQARECADILANAYGMGSRRVGWYADQFESLPAGPTALFLEGWVERERTPPTISVVKQGVREKLESLGASSPVFAYRGERMEALIIWRALLEDEAAGWTRDRIDCRDRILWMNPPCTLSEWDEARVVADKRWVARNEQRARENKPPYPPRPSASWPSPPEPPDPQRILSREEHTAGFKALHDGMLLRLNKEQMVPYVLDAIRKARDLMPLVVRP